MFVVADAVEVTSHVSTVKSNEFGGAVMVGMVVAMGVGAKVGVAVDEIVGMDVVGAVEVG